MRSRSRSPPRNSSKYITASRGSLSRNERRDRDRVRDIPRRSRSRSPVRDSRSSRVVDDFGRERRKSPPGDYRGNRRRSPSPRRDRDIPRRDSRRDRPDRDRPERGRRDRYDGPPRRRSRSPPRNGHGSRSRRTRSSSPDPKKNGTNQGGAVPKSLMERPEITEADLVGKSEEEQEMMKLMGFGGFDTTKGKRVTGNDLSAVNLLQKRKYRQYMNRKGGFNRPLDFVA